MRGCFLVGRSKGQLGFAATRAVSGLTATCADAVKRLLARTGQPRRQRPQRIWPSVTRIFPFLRRLTRGSRDRCPRATGARLRPHQRRRRRQAERARRWRRGRDPRSRVGHHAGGRSPPAQALPAGPGCLSGSGRRCQPGPSAEQQRADDGDQVAQFVSSNVRWSIMSTAEVAAVRKRRRLHGHASPLASRGEGADGKATASAKSKAPSSCMPCVSIPCRHSAEVGQKGTVSTS